MVFFFQGAIGEFVVQQIRTEWVQLIANDTPKIAASWDSMLKTTKPPDKWPDRSCPHHHFSRGSVKLNWCSWNWYSPKLWVANKLKKIERCFGTHPVIGSMSWLYKTVWPMRPIACTVTVQPKIWGLTLHGRLMKGAIFGLKTLAFCDHHCYQDHQWNHPGFKHDFVTRKCCSSDINKALDVNFKKKTWGRGNSLTSHILWDTLTSSLGRLSLPFWTSWPVHLYLPTKLTPSRNIMPYDQGLWKPLVFPLLGAGY